MLKVKPYTFWFATGSQHLYGPETLRQVEAHSRQIVQGLNEDASIPFNIVYKPVLTTPDAIRRAISSSG
jgi:L-arabinose isomerase